VLVLASFLLNLLSVEAVTGLRLWAGALPAMLATLVLGPVQGLVAGLAAGAGLGVSTGDWLTAPVLGLGCLSVGLLIRRGWAPLAAAVAYWSLVGLPVAWVIYRLQFPDGAILNLLRALELPFNAMVGVVLADALRLLPPLRRIAGNWGFLRDRAPFRAYLLGGFTTVATVPLLLLSLLYGRNLSKRQTVDAALDLNRATRTVRGAIQDYIRQHELALITLAHQLEQPRPASGIGSQLEIVRSQYRGFVGLRVFDATGRVQAQTPGLAEAGEPLKPFIEIALRSDEPAISDAVLRPEHPYLVVGVRFRTPGGGPPGVVAGEIALDGFPSLQRSYDGLREVSLLIADHRGQVVFSTRPLEFPTGSPVDGTALWKAGEGAADSGDFRFVLASAARGTGQGTQLACRLTTVRPGGDRAWRVILWQPVIEAERTAAIYYTCCVGCSMGIVAICVLLSGLLAARITKPIERLVERVRAFDLDVPRDSSDSSASGPAEIVELYETFAAMEGRVQSAHGEVKAALVRVDQANRDLREALSSVELQVAERTRQLEEASRRATTADRAKGEFLANMSHEIRTPMNGVLGMLHLLQGTILTAEQKELSDTIHSSAEALLTILNDILDFSKIEAGMMRLGLEPFDLGALVRSVAKLFSGQAAEKGLELRTELDPTLPARVAGDPDRLRQVLNNLVGNAVKFTAAGSVRIAVTVKSRMDGRAKIRLEVTDTGMGMSEEIQGRLFQAFAQGDGSTTRRYGGTGLGLAISRQLVEMMGGTIGVRSRKGEGSAFFVEVEMAFADEPVPGAGPPSAEASPSSPATPKAKRRLELLVVEDDLTNQKFARRLLERLGHAVRVVDNGDDALSGWLSGDRYDAVLLDCQLPTMSGFEVASRLRELEDRSGFPGPKAHIIALTASVLPEDRKKAIESGMNDFLSKPLRVGDLDSALERVPPRSLSMSI
jgi:signal transduction histidine kinase/CheY-like chemotaxis protein